MPLYPNPFAKLTFSNILNAEGSADPGDEEGAPFCDVVGSFIRFS
jgi:hypothetical protein